MLVVFELSNVNEIAALISTDAVRLTARILHSCAAAPFRKFGDIIRIRCVVVGKLSDFSGGERMEALVESEGVAVTFFRSLFQHLVDINVSVEIVFIAYFGIKLFFTYLLLQ